MKTYKSTFYILRIFVSEHLYVCILHIFMQKNNVWSDLLTLIWEYLVILCNLDF